MTKGGSIYILTNYPRKTVLYVGVTSDLKHRIYQHKTGEYKNSFADRFNCKTLVYYESFHYIEEAISREKQIKGGSRKSKLDLINKMNPEWKELFDELV